MTLVAVTWTSSGRQSWKVRSLFDATVIFSFGTEFSFISQSESGLSFSTWRERPSILLTSTLHDTTENSTIRYQHFLCFLFSPLPVWHTDANAWARAFQLKSSFITTTSNRNLTLDLTDRAERDSPDLWSVSWKCATSFMTQPWGNLRAPLT